MKITPIEVVNDWGVADFEVTEIEGTENPLFVSFFYQPRQGYIEAIKKQINTSRLEQTYPFTNA